MSDIREQERGCEAFAQALAEAERKAWDSLRHCEFQSFGWWASTWTHLNHIGGFYHPSPFGPLSAVAAVLIEQDIVEGKDNK